MLTTAKVLDEVLRGPDRECHNTNGCRFVCVIQKYTCITSTKIRDIMGLAEAVGDKYRSRSRPLTKET